MIKIRFITSLTLAALVLAVGCADNPHDTVFIDIVPATANLSTIGQTTQFIAISTNDKDPSPRDVTSSVTWSSASASIATVTSTGLVTAVDCGTTTVIAKQGGIVGQAPVTVSCSTSVQSSQVVVNKIGTGTGRVTSSPTGIDCGSTCAANFTVGTTVVLSAIPDAGSQFVAWAGCNSTFGSSCVVSPNPSLPSNVTVTFNTGP